MPKATLTSLRSWLTQVESAIDHHQTIADDTESDKTRETAEAKVEIFENLQSDIQNAIDELEAL